jgi:hypothetical protein
MVSGMLQVPREVRALVGVVDEEVLHHSEQAFDSRGCISGRSLSVMALYCVVGS